MNSPQLRRRGCSRLLPALLLIGAWAVAPAPFVRAQISAPTTALAAAEKADAGELKIRPPIALSEPQRARLSQLVQADDQAAALWKPIEHEAQTLLDQKPAPIQAINYEGLVNTDARRIETVAHLQDMDDLSVLGYAYAATAGEEQTRYATKMREFVLAWVEAYQPTGNTINENKLEPIIAAYRALQSGETFSPAEKTRVESWLRQMAEAELEFAKKLPYTTTTNWHTKRLKLMAQLGATLGEPKYTDYVAREVKTYVEGSLRPDGTSIDLERRDALSYHVSGLVPFLVLANEMGPAGAELYHYQAPTGASLQKSVAFVAPYARGEKEYPQWRNTTIDLDRRRAAEGLPEYQPGVLWQPKAGLQLFELASSFEPQYQSLVAHLADAPTDARYATWNQVVAAARLQTVSQDKPQL